jgi:hypothetical protein
MRSILCKKAETGSMTSLTEVYEGGAGGANLRRLYLGVGLFVVGAALTIGGILIGASSGVAAALGYNLIEAREIAAVLAGVGVPVTFLGITVVLPPAGRRVRTAAVAGAVVCLFGVVIFAEVYPKQWYGDAVDNTLPVVAVYVLGTLVSFWSLFTAVANFKTRNDPGGTVKLEITKEGKTKVVEVSSNDLRQQLGGVGLLGATPDGEVETQTNRDAVRRPPRRGRSKTASDGGSTSQFDVPGSDAEVLTDDQPIPKQDVYCGNCSHFRYVRTEGDMKPYCAYHDGLLEDMEACSEWSPNNA